MAQTRKLAAVMFTDIVGYTALMSRDEEGAMALLQRNRDLHRPLVAAYSGEVLKEIGDGTLCCFQSALDAVHCAIAIQKQAARESDLSLRIGIHLGDVVFSNGDVFGDGVNVASRIQEVTDPGGICVSEQIYLQIRNHLDVSAMAIGARTFKNVEGPVTVYAVESGDGGGPAMSATALTEKRRKHAFIWAISVVVFAALIVLVYRLVQDGSVHFAVIRSVPLTSAPGLEQDPSWSPEGTRVAYASDEAGNMDVWVRQIMAGQSINLTEGYTGYDGTPAWSPDGEWIAFASERNGGGLFVMPALGGSPRSVTPLSFSTSLTNAGSVPDIAWSPDGRELAYAHAGRLYTISASGGSPEAISLPVPGLIVGYLEPSWSPDGERVVCSGMVGAGFTTSQIWSLHRSEVAPIPVTQGRYLDRSPVWSPDGKTVFFVSDRGGTSDVWWVPVDRSGRPTGPATALTAGAGVGGIALSSDGTRLVYTKVDDRSNIRSVPLGAGGRFRLGDSHPLTAGNAYIESVDVSTDGRWIAYDANNRGNMDIWIMRTDGSELRQLTANEGHDWYPKWSPDGTEILFHSMVKGRRDIFLIPIEGGPQIQLTEHPAEDLAPHWSPDGERIAFLSNRTGNLDIWLMMRDGSNLRQLTHHDGQDIVLVWAPDGTEFVFASDRSAHFELFLLAPDQEPAPDAVDGAVQLTHGEWEILNPVHWSSDGSTIYAYGVRGPGYPGVNFWTISAADGAARPLIDFGESLSEPSHSLSSDGERIYFPLIERTGDLWMVDLATES